MLKRRWQKTKHPNFPTKQVLSEWSNIASIEKFLITVKIWPVIRFQSERLKWRQKCAREKNKIQLDGAANAFPCLTRIKKMFDWFSDLKCLSLIWNTRSETRTIVKGDEGDDDCCESCCVAIRFDCFFFSHNIIWGTKGRSREKVEGQKE